MQHFYRMGLGYLNRGAPNDTMIISGKDIVRQHHSFMELEDGTMIPYHRILKIFYYRESIPFPTLKNLFHKFSRDGKLVWEKPFSSLKKRRNALGFKEEK